MSDSVSTPIWPAVNASLNALSGVLLMVGYIAIKRKQVPLHKTCMVSALASSALFLISYLAYHSQHGSTRFQGVGGIRTLYFSILISHTTLAAVIVPMVIMTARRALKGNFEAHKRIARWTFPLWMYVSVTGVIVYFMLYQF